MAFASSLSQNTTRSLLRICVIICGPLDVRTEAASNPSDSERAIRSIHSSRPNTSETVKISSSILCSWQVIFSVRFLVNDEAVVLIRFAKQSFSTAVKAKQTQRFLDHAVVKCIFCCSTPHEYIKSNCRVERLTTGALQRETQLRINSFSVSTSTWWLFSFAIAACRRASMLVRKLGSLVATKIASRLN